MLQAFAPIQRATLEARARLGDKSIGTTIKQGRLQVVRVTYNAKGRSTVVPVSDWLAMPDAVKFLDALQ